MDPSQLFPCSFNVTTPNEAIPSPVYEDWYNVFKLECSRGSMYSMCLEFAVPLDPNSHA